MLEFQERTAEEVRDLLDGGAPNDYLKVRRPDGEEIPLVVVCKARVPEETRAANIKANIARPVQRFLRLPYLFCQRKNPQIALVAGGPSLPLYLDKIRGFDAVLACGSVHDYLIDNGIIPTYALVTDPAVDTIEFYKNRHEKVIYLLASQADPNMFEWLQDYAVVMWHFKGQVGTPETEHEYFNGEETINWGCMVGVNAIQMALMLGYQQLHFFGYDCCLSGRTHAYAIKDEETKEINEARTVATVGDHTGDQKQFSTTTALITQACQIFEVFKSPDGAFLKGHVYGDGLFANVVKRSPPEMKRWLEAVDAT